MNIEQIKKVWDQVYNKDINDLPWIHTKIPDLILKKFISHIQSPYYILDFGCGTGRLSQYISSNSYITIDLYDISNKAMVYCKEYTKSININYIDDIKQITKKYQGILCWGVFHHLPEEAWKFYLNFFYDHLCDGGILLFSDFTKRDPLYRKQNSLTSEITQYSTYAVEFSLINNFFSILDKGTFRFIENKRKKLRVLDYVIAQK